MKQAILITAYKDFFRLIDLIDSFDDRFDIYIHIDKRIYVSETCMRMMRAFPCVKKVGCVYSINWGSRKHVDAILWLCRQALENSPDAQYFHLISGADMLIKSSNDFCDFFSANSGRNFIEYFPLPSKTWSGGGFNRLVWMHPLERLNILNQREMAIYERYLRFQHMLSRPRPLPSHAVYGGSCWWSLTREAVMYICGNYNKDGWYSRLENTFAPDEMYVQTLLATSYLKPTMVNNNLRYILWEHQNGHCPAILDEGDAYQIVKSDKMFARKIDSCISKKLIEFTDNYLHKKIL